METSLARYLNDHYAGSTSGLLLFRRATRRHPELAAVTQQVEQDRRSLQQLMRRIGAQPARHRAVLGWIGAQLARLVLDRRVSARGPVADVEQLETLLLGVEGKAALWRLLLELDDDRFDRDRLGELLRRAQAQAASIERLRVRHGQAVLRG